MSEMLASVQLSWLQYVSDYRTAVSQRTFQDHDRHCHQ